MKRGLLISLMAFITILSLNVSAQAEISMTQVTTNSYEDSSPHILGNYLVWQGEVGGDWEIFLCNVATGEDPLQITDNTYSDVSPQTDGNYLVWLGFSQPDSEVFLPGGEIFLYNILNGDTTQITNDSDLDSPPQIANGKVVWTSHEVTDSVEPGEIFLYDTANETTSPLSASVDPYGTLDDFSPRINGKDVMWIQADDIANTKTVFIHDLAQGITTPAPQGFVWEDSPQTDGELTVLSRYDGNDREIFVHSTTGGGIYEQLTDNDFEDNTVSISGNHIAWVGGEGPTSEIFVASYYTEYIILLIPEDGEILPKRPPPTFLWESAGYDEFKVQFSGDVNFPKRKTLTLPPWRDLSEGSYTPRRWEWGLIRWMERRNGSLYWRVRAEDEDGNVAFSNALEFTIEKSKGLHRGLLGRW